MENILPLSIVIPAKNEEKYIPKLLKSIALQEFKPFEVIVADNSIDNTAKIANEFGAKVVKGGIVSVGRNNGVKAAIQENVLFLDADMVLPNKYFLGKYYIAFKENNLDIASTLLGVEKSDTNSISQVFTTGIIRIWNSFRKLHKYTKKVMAESGGTIMVKRSVFNKLGGFNEKAFFYGEDYEFTTRAIKEGFKYKVLPLTMNTSPRRFDSPTKSLKMLSGAVLMGTIIGFGLVNREHIVKFTRRLYGDLGGGKNPEDD